MLATAAAPPPLTVKLFGTFLLLAGDREIPLRGRKACALLAYVLLALRQRATREHIADLLWTDRAQEQARASLRQTLAELRAIPGIDAALAIERSEIALRPGAVVSDFAQVLDACRRRDLAALAAELAEMDGALLDSLGAVSPGFDEWLAIERSARLEQLVSHSLACVEQAGMSRAEDALTVLRLLDRLDPLNEGVARLGMRLDHAGNDSAALHRRYRRLAGQLQAEFGAQPAEATRSLFQQLTKDSRQAGIATPLQNPSADRAAPPAPADELVPAVIVAPLQVLGDAGLTNAQAEFCSDDMRLAIAALNGVKVLAADTSDVPAMLASSADSLALYLLSGKVSDPGTGAVAMLQLANARDRSILWSDSISLSAVVDPVATLVAKAVGALQPAIDRDLDRIMRTAQQDSGDERAAYTRARLMIRSAADLAETLAGVDALEGIVARNPRHLGARLLLGRMYNTDFWQQITGHDVHGLREKAAAHLEAAARLAPDRVDVRVRRAWVLLRQGAYDAAARDFDAVLGERQLDPDILNQCGFGLCHLGKLDRAEAVMQQAFDLNPFAPSDCHADFAVIQALLGRAEQAEEHFLVSGETGLQYDAVRIANFAVLPALPLAAASIEARFIRKFRGAWQAARAPAMDDVIRWVGDTLPLREAEHRQFVTNGLEHRLAESWLAS